MSERGNGFVVRDSWFVNRKPDHDPRSTIHDSRNAQEVLREGARRLREAGLESAEREAEWLLGHLLSQKPAELYLREAPVPEDIAAAFFAHVAARATGTPLQYLLKDAEFFGERFLVAPGVFIPRPETEAIVEAALHHLRARQRRLDRPLRLLDAGTGTGCIAITLARALAPCVVVGVEVSWDVLEIARANVARYQLSSRVHLVRGRWTGPFPSGNVFDGVVSNPPYIPSAHVDRLPLDVRREPRLSLDGGADGMRHLRELIEGAPRVLAPGGLVALECGEEHVEPLCDIARAAGWSRDVLPLRDLANRPRGLLIAKKDSGFSKSP